MKEQKADEQLPSSGNIPVRLLRPEELEGLVRHTKEDWEEAAREVREEEIARARAHGIKPFKRQPEKKDGE